MKRGLLRWYPRAWRERYGDELLEVIERATDGKHVPMKMGLDIARNGIRQRLVDAGVAGAAPARARIRGGSLLVLWTFGAVVIAGIALQRYAEHWQDAAHGSLRWAAQISFVAVQGLAAAGAIILLLAGVAGLPTLGRFLAGGGWPLVRRRFWISVAICSATVAAMGGVVVWAHHLTTAQRNGGSSAYIWAAIGLALLFCASIGTLAALVSRVARAVDLPQPVLRFEGALAIALEITMTLLAFATAAWWATVAHIAPWFFRTSTASPGAPTTSALNSTMPLVLGLMVAGVAVGAIGARRVHQGLARPE